MRLHETAQRSIVKTVTYRIVLLISSFIVAYIFTNDTNKTIGITLVSNGVATIAYFLHERFWNRVHWGKEVKK